MGKIKQKKNAGGLPINLKGLAKEAALEAAKKIGEKAAEEALKRLEKGMTQTHEGEATITARCTKKCEPPKMVQWRYQEDDAFFFIWDGEPTDKDIQAAADRICAAGMTQAEAALRAKAQEKYGDIHCQDPCVPQMLYGNIICTPGARSIKRGYGWEIRATADYCMDVVLCCVPPGTAVTTPQTGPC